MFSILGIKKDRQKHYPRPKQFKYGGNYRIIGIILGNLKIPFSVSASS